MLSLQFPLLLLAISSFPLSNENGVYGKIRFFIGRMGAFIVPAYTLHTRGVESSNLPSATENPLIFKGFLIFRLSTFEYLKSLFCNRLFRFHESAHFQIRHLSLLFPLCCSNNLKKWCVHPYDLPPF